MNDPRIVLLDEPSGRLDLGGREQLVRAIDESIEAQPNLASAIVTHHVDEIPAQSTHLLALRAGRVEVAGPIDDVLDDELLSRVFDWPLRVERLTNGRFSARSR